MPPPDTAATTPNAQAAELRALRQRLADATPGQMEAVVELVDSLPERGAADGLIAPLRPLLLRLQPNRRLTMTRLIFLPVNTLIVAPRGWQRGAASLPRSAITPLAAAAIAALGRQAEDIAAAIGPARMQDLPRLAGPATMLWDAVAAIFADPAFETALAERAEAGTPSGLTATELAGMAKAIAPMLRVGCRLLDPNDPGLPAALLTAAGGVCPLSWEMALALLLDRMDDRAGVLATAHQLASQPAHHRALDSAQVAVLGRLQTRIGALRGAPCALAAAELERAAAIITLVGEAGQVGKHAISGLASTFAAIARARLAGALTEDLLKPLHHIAANDGAAFAALEDVVRDIRRLDFAGRSLGPAAAQDAAIAAAAGAVAGREDLPAVCRARLVELMLGAEAAALRFPQVQ